MQDFNYNINLIPDFRLRKKLLDITPINVKGRLLRINPIMTTNLLIIEKKTSKYMSDKLAMLYNSIIRDNTLVITGKGLITRKYIIKYELGKLSIVFNNKLNLTVSMPKKMTALIDSDEHMYDKTNFAIMLYVSSAIMNIPKYEYPIPIVNNDTHISTITVNDIDVLYAHKDVSPFPKKIKKLTTDVLDVISVLKNRGDVISYIDTTDINGITRVLSLINYCRYYDVVTSELITLLLGNVSNIKIDYDHLDNMIDYMSIYRDLLNIKDKYITTVPKKQFN